MPVTSMTGFARWEGVTGATRVVWELRSVNGEGFDLRLRLPPGFEALEPELKRRVSGFTRGNVQGALQITTENEAPELVVNEALLARIVAIAGDLVSRGHATPPTADGLLALRGVIEPRGATAAADWRQHPSEAIISGFEVAAERLLEARQEEGAAIGAVLLSRLGEIDALIERAEADPSRTPGAIAARLRGQVEMLLSADAELDPARLAQEAALIATRADIREEIDRLRAHVEAARALLAAGGPVGRRLDFLSQEFHRESNTICSKSNAASLTVVGLELKLVVDQFREQVQNVE
ncbi:YicC/YloC family endoribonuclease [Aureimonas mangrovi]|uniref:YicC/YloC family endoribonuclease n=1 Tax=Aureimonas mangrovi TaxID=2758041 RepID=UPI00163DAA2A|nr:YicC/YloC family endoribonuclease [Aureimonas mangrovi]